MRLKTIINIMACMAITGCAQSMSNTQNKSMEVSVTEEVYVDTLALNHPEYLPEIILGSEAPDFAVPDMDGKEVKLSDFSGSYVVLDFWATWCGDCRREMPDLKVVFDEYAAKQINGKDIKFVSFSLDREADAWKNYVMANDLKWTHVSTLQPKWRDIKATGDYGLHWIPAFVIVSPDGNVVYKSITVASLREGLKGLIK